jgi:acyl-CoA thioester hydrolase
MNKRLVSKISPTKYFLEASVWLTPAYQDADPGGVVWHGNYFRYFDQARCALLEEIDYNYRQMEASGYSWPIVDTHVRFVSPATFGEKIQIFALLREFEYRLVIDYLIKNESGSIITKGQTTQVAVEIQSGELLFGSPDILIEKLSRIGIRIE